MAWTARGNGAEIWSRQSVFPRQGSAELARTARARVLPRGTQPVASGHGGWNPSVDTDSKQMHLFRDLIFP